jgi:PEGA domain
MVLRQSRLFCAAALLALGAAGCLKAAATLSLTPAQGTPADARVTIDEEFVGTLGFVSARGVRLPAGDHHITVERDGYFPFDVIVESNGDPIPVDVRLVRLPE